MNKANKSLTHLIDLCRSKKIKVTPQRVAIYNELIDDLSHPTADSIYKRVHKKHPEISFDTVNRTLLRFAEIDIIRTVEGLENQRRFDPGLQPHHHFQCLNCHQIIDFNDQEYDKLTIPSQLTEKHQINHFRVVLSGVCKNCLSKN